MEEYSVHPLGLSGDAGLGTAHFPRFRESLFTPGSLLSSCVRSTVPVVDPPGCFRQLLGISAGLEAEAGLLYSARSLKSCESVIQVRKYDVRSVLPRIPVVPRSDNRYILHKICSGRIVLPPGQRPIPDSWVSMLGFHVLAMINSIAIDRAIYSRRSPATCLDSTK